MYRKNLEIKRGDTFLWEVTVTSNGVPLDLTTKTLKGQARKGTDDPLWFELNINVLDAANGRIQILHSAAETLAMSETELTGIYDIQYTDSVTGFVKTIIGGNVTVYKDVTYGGLA